jgi:DNA-binding NarL/FixJ family response regulator
LPPSARRFTQVLAVGGRNAPLQVISAVAERALPGQDPLAVLSAASAARILDRQPDGSFWFHHPLIAETLASETPAEERIRWHRLFADAYSPIMDAGGPDPRLAADLARHAHKSGQYEEAYRRTLEAASLESAAQDWDEALAHYRRALELRPKVTGAVEGFCYLWDQVRRSAFNAGAFDAELEAVESLMSLRDEHRRPAEVAGLIVRRMHLRMSLGQSFLDATEAERAERLSSVQPERWQHALAMAELIHARLWNDQYNGSPDCAEVLETARKTGHHGALSYALTAAAMAAVFDGNPDRAREAARVGVAEAALARDFWAYCHALAWLGNATEGWISEEYGNIMKSGREELSQLGAPHSFTSKVAADEAASFLAIGSWQQARTALRTAISFDPGPMGDVSSRLTLARLEALQGRTDDALAHLARAEEVDLNADAFINLNFAAIRAELNIMAGNPEVGLETALSAASRPGNAPTMCEWLLPLAMRAAADMITHARDAGMRTTELENSVKELRQRFPAALHEPGQPTPLYQRQTKAFDLLYAAETGRALGDQRNAEIWIEAAKACEEANLAWEEAYACQRAGEALLFHTHNGQSNAAAILRHGLDLATTLQAAAVRTAILRLAEHGRIQIADDPVRSPRSNSLFPGLTARETEILHLLAAGRTYKEIAHHFFISEKTVSTHVSHLLQKTGSTNRTDLARKVSERRGVPPS